MVNLAGVLRRVVIRVACQIGRLVIYGVVC